MRLSDILAERRVVTIDIGGQPLQCTMNPQRYTAALETQVLALDEAGKKAAAPVEFLAATLVDWDLTDDDGQPFPPSRANLERLGTPFLWTVIHKLGAANVPNAPSGATSAAS